MSTAATTGTVVQYRKLGRGHLTGHTCPAHGGCVPGATGHWYTVAFDTGSHAGEGDVEVLMYDGEVTKPVTDTGPGLPRQEPTPAAPESPEEPAPAPASPPATPPPAPDPAVNAPFTPPARSPAKPRHRRRRHRGTVETPEYVRMMHRMMRGLGRRVAGMDVASLPELAAVADIANGVLRDTARKLHDQGYSWGEIGRELGITRQGAYQRFGRENGDTR